MNFGETPQEVLRREFMEETNIEVEAAEIIDIRFNWYIAFRAEYVSGEAMTDNDENSEVLWIDIEEAFLREDVLALTKELIASAVSKEGGLKDKEYEGNMKNGLYSLYCV